MLAIDEWAQVVFSQEVVMLVAETLTVELSADELALIVRALAEYREHSIAEGLVVYHIDQLSEKLSDAVED
jgi:hypothetical protein